MINEERVKEQYKVALYDTNCAKMYQQVTSYYKRDYVGKELLKSFFSGSIVFLGIIVLYVMYNLDTIIDELNTMDYITVGTSIGLLYLIFILAYEFLTVLIFTTKYEKGRKDLRENAEHLKKIYKMYEREEKLK